MIVSYIRDEIRPVEVPPYNGQRYETLAPHTFDLAERMALAVNGLTGPTDPKYDYELYFRLWATGNPPVMNHDGGDPCVAKFMEALPLMRIASGTELNVHVERCWMESWLRMIGPDGLHYWPERPWVTIDSMEPVHGDRRLGQYALPLINGRFLAAMTIYAIRDPDGPWRRACRRMVDALGEWVIDRGEWAYFPVGALAPGAPRLTDAPVPRGTDAMRCGARVIPALVQYHRAFDYEPAIVLAGKLARYFLEHGCYIHPDGSWMPDKPADGELVDPHAHAPDLALLPKNVEEAHFHGHTVCLEALLDYALAVGDTDLAGFVEKSYCWGAQHGARLIGFFPESLFSSRIEIGEICETADMIALAIKLSAAHIGDYWDDAERYLRNHFAECQLTKPYLFDRVPERLIMNSMRPNSSRGGTLGRMDHWASPEQIPDDFCLDRVIERNVGAFSGYSPPNDWGPGSMHCCTGNAARALYYAWEHALTEKDGVLSVNLLMNRASALADVHSHLPYTGRIDVSIKRETRLKIRIPGWVKPDEATCTFNGAQRTPSWEDRYAAVGRATKGDQVSLTFPISEESLENVYIEKQPFTLVIKGYEVVAIDPPGRLCPLYQRDHYRQGNTLWKRVTRFISDEEIYW